MLALVLACGVSWTSSPSAAAAPAPRISLTVRVYPPAGLPSALQTRALAEAEAVFLAALVDVQWQVCARRSASPACDEPPGPSEVLLVVRAGTACDDSAVTLGEAIVRRAGGVLATVYADCVRRLATQTGADVGLLLGRVAAHELGHLMMRTSAHARRGLMRPNWTREEVRRNRAGDWAFTAADAAAMRQPTPDPGGIEARPLLGSRAVVEHNGTAPIGAPE